MLPEALKVLEAWGFAYKTVAFTWIKRNENVTPVMGMGNWTRQNAEFCLLGIRGSGVTRKDKSVMSIIETSRLRHSEKPEEARERIVKLCGDVPKIELFSRQQVEGWDYFGNEVG
jgi:site-specific DNA-methyltransferase (adenine-specific)